MIRGLIVAFFALVAIVTIAEAGERERATYVGGGRYVGEGRSVDDARLRQQNNEWTQRQYDRAESQSRYERYEQREREYDYDRQGRDWSEY